MYLEHRYVPRFMKENNKKQKVILTLYGQYATPLIQSFGLWTLPVGIKKRLTQPMCRLSRLLIKKRTPDKAVL